MKIFEYNLLYLKLIFSFLLSPIFISAIFTYIYIVPLGIPHTINLTNSDDILSFIMIMLLFTFLFTKFIHFMTKS
jgi:hypothetical protein